MAPRHRSHKTSRLRPQALALAAVTLAAPLLATLLFAVKAPQASAGQVEPLAPSECSFTRVGDEAIVTFTPALDDGADRYIVERNRNNIGWRWADRIYPGETTEHRNFVLAKDSVQFRVKSRDGSRWSSATPCPMGEMVGEKRPAPVTDLTATWVGETTVELTWTNDDDDRRISFDFFVDNQWVGYVRDADATKHRFTGLTPGSEVDLGVTVIGDRSLDWATRHFSPRETVTVRTERAGTVVWEEHFDSLDTSVWQPEHSTYGNKNNDPGGTVHCYLPENVSVADGALVLHARQEFAECPQGDRQVSSGMVRRFGDELLKPGQALEFRVKLTPHDDSNQAGLWPAVWTSGLDRETRANAQWPYTGEIDFLEVMTAKDPTRSLYSIHFADPADGHGKVNHPPHFIDANFSDDWRVIRFEYEVGQLRWYQDGVLAQEITSANTYQGWPAPFDRPVPELRINMAIGGAPGALAPGVLSGGDATFAVDWIRVVQMP